MAQGSVTAEPVLLRFGEFELDEANALLRRNGRAVDVAPTPFRVLCALARQPGALLTKNALLDAVWGHRFVSDSVLKSAISDVRNTLGDDPRAPQFIETVSRRGYRFIGRAVAPPPATSTQPGNAAADGAPPFVGRTGELARLHRAWQRALQGRRVVMWVAGQPGIGKSSLVERFAATLGDVTCARGYCVEHYGTGEPYLPVLEALAELCRRDADAAGLLHAVAPTWLAQLPWLSTVEEREALRRELSGVGPERMLREMGELLDRYTERRPLLLVTEDLHWADRSTSQLIDYVARRRGSSRLMWLATFRVTEVVAFDHPLNALRHELRVQGLCEEIVLSPFSEAEVADYVAARSPSIAGDEATVRALHARTDGVPLFVASVTGDVIARAEEGGGPDATAAFLRDRVPETLGEIIEHYLARLDDDRRALLAAAAVCGLEFRGETLARVVGGEVGDVVQTCERFAREGLWLVDADVRGGRSGRAFAFRHALFREVLYSGVPPAALADLHRRVGIALEAEREAGTAIAAAELAMHFERGRAPARALHHYTVAAESALTTITPAECAELCARAARLVDQVPDSVERTALLIRLATARGVAAFHLLGVGADARAAFVEAAALLDDAPDHPLRGLVLHGLGFVHVMRGEYVDALAVAARAEAMAEALHDPLLVLAAAATRGHVHLMQGRPRDAVAVLERGLERGEPASAAARGSFIADPVVSMLGILGLELGQLGLLRQARARLAEAHARARRLRQPVAHVVALWFDALLEVRLGTAERVAALAEEMRGWAESAGVAQARAPHRWFQGWVEARRGRALDGYRMIRDAYEDNTALGMVAGGSEVLGYAAEALVERRDWDGAQRTLEQAFGIVERYGERAYLPRLHHVQAAVDQGRGDQAAAEDSLRRAIAEAATQGARWLELQARTELCRRGAATPEERRTLALLVEDLPEAVDTAAVGLARQVLDL